MDPVDDLVRAIDRYTEARKKHDKAFEKYDGYSWDYYGHYEIKALDEARDAFRAALDGYVDARVKAAMGLKPAREGEEEK
jgi:hypothetical protein